MNKLTKNDMLKFSEIDRDIFMHLYFKFMAGRIIEGLSKISSSRAKDEELFRWRFASNLELIYGVAVAEAKLKSYEKLIKEANSQAERGKFLAQAQLLAAKFAADKKQSGAAASENLQLARYDIDLKDLDLDFRGVISYYETLPKESQEMILSQYNQFSQELAESKNSQPGFGE